MVAQLHRFGTSFRSATSVDERKGRMRWIVSSYAIAAAVFISGIGFVIGNGHNAPSPIIYSYVAPFPGGLRTHGVIQIILGSIYLHALVAFGGRAGRRAWNEMLYIAIGVSCYLWFNAYGFTAYAIVSRQFIATPILYGALAVISSLNVVLPPNRRDPDPDPARPDGRA